jgi:hydrogen cyanide synthase HcnC
MVGEAGEAARSAGPGAAAFVPDDAVRCDVAVVGGGLVGAAIARGLAGRGLRTVILDEGDVAHRASRGNFALVWVQSKGLGMARYGAWTRLSSDTWADLARELRDETGTDVAHQRPGGFALALSEDELKKRLTALVRMHNQPGWIPYKFEVLDRAAVQRVFPQVGPDVAGGVYCPLDGPVNSLRLFRALHESFRARGGRYLPGRPVSAIARDGAGFRIATAEGPVRAARVVLAAGIANARLAPMVGLTAPVRPQRGQVLVTERCAPFLSHPLVSLRQTDEGSVMIGDSAEEAGPDDRIGLGVLGVMAERAVRMFPAIGRLNVVRSWAALRVMTQDGLPVYDQSDAAAPGAFLATCHSGVTLAAVHSGPLAGMIADGALAADMAPFSARRFDVPAVA